MGRQMMHDRHTAMEWLVMQHHDGQLPVRHRTAVDAHLAVCASCRDYGRVTRAAGDWLQASTARGARAVPFQAVWTGLAARLTEPASLRAQFSRWAWQRPLRLSWLAAGSLAAAVLLLLVNPLTHLPGAPSHEAYVAFVEGGDYPVMVLSPSTPGDMTVIWLFEPRAAEAIPAT
jgi:anti-sigma factor RsiW